MDNQIDPFAKWRQQEPAPEASGDPFAKWRMAEEEPTGITWGEAWESAKKVAPSNAVETGVGLLKSLTPIPAFERFNRIMEDPKGESEATLKHYTDYFSEEGLKEKLATNPIGTAVEVGGVAALRPVRSAPRVGGMPRGSVRTGEELLATGGKRIEEAKLNPSKVDKEALATPLQEFRNATQTITITSPVVNNIARRLETAHTPNKPGAMDKITKVGAEPKPDLTLTELHGHLQRLDDFIGRGGKAQDGRINNQGRAAIELKNAISKMIEDHPDSGGFKVGKSEYHRGKMDQALGDLLKAAEQRRQWKNGDEAGALAAEVGLFLKNKKNRYAFTPEIRAKLAKVSGDKKGRLIGAFGATNMGGFTFGRMVEAATGLPTGSTMIAGVPVRAARNKRVIDAFKRIQEEVRAGGLVE